MIGSCASARIAAHRRGELEAVHARHLDVGEDDVEALPGLQQGERFLRRRGAVTA